MVLELNRAFKHILYDDLNHSYIDANTGELFTSVTQFLGKLKEPFDTEYWSAKKAKEKKVSKEEMLQEWKYKKELGNSRGNYLHACMEKLNQRDTTWLFPNDYMTSEVLKAVSKESALTESFPFNPPIRDSFDILRDLSCRFIQENKILIPIVQEFVIGDSDLGIAGRFDALYFNEFTQEYEIWDYKTDKKLEFTNQYGKKLKIFDVDDCEYEKYSLQLSLYKYIIEKNTGLKLGKSNIVYFKHGTKEYEILPTKDYTDLIKEKLNGNNWSTCV